MIITPAQVKAISTYIEDNASFDCKENDEGLGVFRTYSGRGMYGKYCLGITISSSNAFELAMLIGEALLEEDDIISTLREEFCHPRTDSMGYDVVYYWSRIIVAGTEELP